MPRIMGLIRNKIRQVTMKTFIMGKSYDVSLRINAGVKYNERRFEPQKSYYKSLLIV